MPIQVTCPECLFAFAVADEYAGQQGRCAECGSVIRVPGGASKPTNPYATAHDDDDAYDTLTRSRRAPQEPPPMPDREGREPRSPRRSRTPTFDPKVRAARWHKVANGYRNLMLAAVLNVFGWGLLTAYIMTAGIDKFERAQVDDGRIAAEMGLYAATAIALAFWTIGRVAGRSTPYVPARMMSMGSSVCALLGGGSSVLGLAGMAVGAMVARNDLNAAVAIFGLSMLGVMFGSVLVVIGELLGLISQIRIADALQASGFGTMSKLIMAVFMLGTAGMFCCSCMVFMVAAQEAERQQAKQLKQQDKKKKEANNGNGGNFNPQDEEKPKIEEKPKVEMKPKIDEKPKNEQPKDKVAEKPKVEKKPKPKKNENPKNENPKDEQPKDKDKDEDEDDEPEPDPAKMRTAQQVVMAITFLGVLFASGFYFQCARMGRRAILQEVERLGGNEDEATKEHDYGG